MTAKKKAKATKVGRVPSPKVRALLDELSARADQVPDLKRQVLELGRELAAVSGQLAESRRREVATVALLADERRAHMAALVKSGQVVLTSTVGYAENGPFRRAQEIAREVPSVSTRFSREFRP